MVTVRVVLRGLVVRVRVRVWVVLGSGVVGGMLYISPLGCMGGGSVRSRVMGMYPSVEGHLPLILGVQCDRFEELLVSLGPVFCRTPNIQAIPIPILLCSIAMYYF